MSNVINAFFQFLQDHLGLLPSGVATIALFSVLVVVILALVIFARLRSSRKVIEQLAERLGYEPPYGDGQEIVHEEVRKDIVQRGKELKLEQLEIRIGELEAEGQHKDANFTALQKHSQELEEQLRQAALQNDAVAAQMGAQAKTHRTALEQLEQRMRDSEAESNNNLTALHHRSKELEEQLQQAFLRNDKVMALANDQAQAHQRTVEQFDQQMRDVDTENNAKLTAVQRRSKELEEQLLKATQHNEQIVAQATEQLQEHRDTIAKLEGRIRQMEVENETSQNELHQRARQYEEQMREAVRQKDGVLAQAGEVAQAHRESVAQLEERIRQVEGEGRSNLNALQQHAKELEEQLQQVYQQRDQVMAQAGEQAQAHREKLAQVDQHIREIEAQGRDNLNALEQRGRELEEQLGQAALHHERITAQAGEQAQAHRETVAQLEGRMRQMEDESNANQGASQQRARDLEEQLRQAAQHHERIAVEAGEQAKAYRETMAQLEGRLRQVEGESNANLGAVQQYARELEERLQQATLRHEGIAAQASEQARIHGETVGQLEGRIRQMEGESDANLDAVKQYTRELEERLQQATLHHEGIAAQASEQARIHGETVAQLEGRIRQIEGERHESLTALDQRAKDLEEQLERAAIRTDKVTAQAGEQIQGYRMTVEKLEERIHAMATEGNANLSALHQRTQDLENELREATSQHENEKSIAQQAVLERTAGMEQLAARVRDLEAEKEVKGTHLQTLQAHIGELEGQLQEAASRVAPERVEVAKVEAGAGTAEELLHRAEWIMSRAVGAILPHGLVAAEAYASAALAANPQGTAAPELLAELARIRRAYPEGLPPVTEAVTGFDEKAAAFFAADPARVATIADEEAQRRYRAGLNRSALLMTNTALELRQETDAADSPEAARLQEMRAALLARLGDQA
jgi:chromosome segregation ATPase